MYRLLYSKYINDVNLIDLWESQESYFCSTDYKVLIDRLKRLRPQLEESYFYIIDVTNYTIAMKLVRRV